MRIGIVSVILISIISYGLFFYLQVINAQSIRESIFNSQLSRQLESTKAITQHIGSDLRLVVSMLQDLADSIYIQQGYLSGDNTSRLLDEKFLQLNTVTKVDGLFIADNEHVITIHKVAKDLRSFVNIDISSREYVNQTKSTLRPVFSNGFEWIDGKYKITITYPIISRANGEYLGLLAAEIPTVKFFENYGNVYDLNSQFLVAFDRNANLLAVGASSDLVGKNFFENYTQNFVNHNKILNKLTRDLLAGKAGNAVYDYGKGERLNTQSPILVGSEPSYFLQIVTPTTTIYSQVNSVLFTEGIKLFSLISGTTAAIILLVFILGKWNSTLDNEVKRRTHELNESNNKLNVANEELKKHERAQKDFINMAAHELRNPIQPLLSTCYLLRSGTGDSNKNNDLLDIAIRSIERLQRLAEDILDVTRIESNTLKIRKERFNLDELITNIIEEYRKNIQETKEIKLNYHSKNKGLVVNGDKTRLGQVLSNLLSNSLKFTKQGYISVDTEIKDGYVVVTVSDTGTGIDKEILPKLFSKFSTRSITGTGLGLFISKSIVEAHGGKIWAEKNSSKEPGATFRFTLPISERYESGENTKEE
jgi:signal transduction histidine kinase